MQQSKAGAAGAGGALGMSALEAERQRIREDFEHRLEVEHAQLRQRYLQQIELHERADALRGRSYSTGMGGGYGYGVDEREYMRMKALRGREAGLYNRSPLLDKGHNITKEQQQQFVCVTTDSGASSTIRTVRVGRMYRLMQVPPLSLGQSPASISSMSQAQ